MSDAGEDWTELENFVRMLIDTGNASLESKIPDREPLQWALDKLGKFCAAIEAVEQSNHLSPAHKRAAKRSLVLGALAAAFEIGSHGTASKNTEVYIKAVGTAPARSTAAKNREPDNERIRQAIAEAEKDYPPDRRGNIKRIAQKAGIDPRTVRRHRKKKRTS
jgi:hypothetical protein